MVSDQCITVGGRQDGKGAAHTLPGQLRPVNHSNIQTHKEHKHRETHKNTDKGKEINNQAQTTNTANQNISTITIFHVCIVIEERTDMSLFV